MAINEVPSVGEVLEVLATYRAQLISQKGREWVQNYPISDEWGDGMTTTALLLRNPEDRWYLVQLEDTGTRERVYDTLLALQGAYVRA